MKTKEMNDAFWLDIVQNPDGSLNREQVLKELSDFSMLIEHISKLYDLASGGRISYPTTSPEAVYSEFKRQLSAMYEDGYADGFNDGEAQ